MSGRAYTVIYDGACGMCCRLARTLVELDRKRVFEVAPSQQGGIEERFPWITREALDRALQLVRQSDGRTWEGAAAVEQIVRRLRGGRLVSWLFAVPFARGAADRVYRLVAENRSRLGCGEHCPVQATRSGASE